MDSELKLSIEEHFPATVTSVSHLATTMKNVKSRLTATQLERLRQSPIGRLVDVDFKFCGPLIHQVLLREISQPKEDEMSFMIGGRVITFTKDDFARITGLPRGRSFVRRDDSIRLRELLFKDQYGVSKFDFDKKFLANRLIEDEDVIKLTLVYIVELVLIGGLRRNKIDMSFLSLVDHEEMWDSFDWVDTIYSITLGSLKDSIAGKIGGEEEEEKNEEEENKSEEKKNKSEEKKNIVEATYSLAGFPYAFQAWIFEQMPELVQQQYVSREDTIMPPVCSWHNSVKAMTTKSLLKNIFFPIDKVKPSKKVEDVEKKKVEKKVEKKKVDKEMEDEDKCRKTKRPRADKIEVPVEDSSKKDKKRHGLSSKYKQAIMNCEERGLRNEARLERVEADIRTMMSMIANIEKLLLKGKDLDDHDKDEDDNEALKSRVEEFFVNEERVDKMVEEERVDEMVDEEIMEKMEKKEEEIVEKIEKNEEEIVEKMDRKEGDAPERKEGDAPEKDEGMVDTMGEKEREEVTNFFDSQQDVVMLTEHMNFKKRPRGTRQRKLGPLQKSPFVTERKEKLEKYDPLYVVGLAVTKGYRAYFQDKATDDTPVPCQYYGDKKKPFFLDWIGLGDPHLGCEHLDTAFLFIQDKLRSRPEFIKQRFTVVDSYFAQYCMRSWKKYEEAVQNNTVYDWTECVELLNYVVGKHGHFTISWGDCDWVYAPVNVKNKHWILLCINIRQRQYVYYDSLPTYCTEEEVDTMLAPVRDCISHVLANTGLCDSVDRWPIKRIENTPIQDNSVDCGVYTIKFYECLVTGNSLKILTPDKFKRFRYMLSYEIWSNKPIF